MKREELEPGWFYSDGKDGVRELISVDRHGGDQDQVTYRLLWAKVTLSYCSLQARMVSCLGSTVTCQMGSFAAWAKSRMNREECDALLMRLKARRVKLSPGERAFMDSALQEAAGSIPAGTLISVDLTEGRAVGGLERKGLLVRRPGEAEFTALGAAWLQDAAQRRAAEATQAIRG